MKENKSKGLQKMLMMATAAVLVAAVSIGVTLAYLTATTTEKVNNFTANTDALQGLLSEPKFTSNKTNVRPGDKYDKDPLVENLTTTDSMWTGIKMTFKINGITVPYSTFKQYVALYSDSDPTAAGRYLDSGDDKGYTDNFSSAWANVTEETTDNSGALYFVYKTALAANLNNGTSDANGSSDGNDTTTPIFKNVYLNPNITVVSATNGSPTIRSATADASAYLGAVPITSGNAFTKTFDKMDFEVEIKGYGVSGTTYADLASAKPVILTGLGTTAA